MIYLINALQQERDRAQAAALRERAAREALLQANEEVSRQQRLANFLQRTRQLLIDTIEPETVMNTVLEELTGIFGGKVILVLENNSVSGDPTFTTASKSNNKPRFWKAGHFPTDAADKFGLETLLNESYQVIPLRANGQELGRLAYAFEDQAILEETSVKFQKVKLGQSSKDVELLANTLHILSEYIAISLENAQLYQTVEFQNNEIAQLLRNGLRTDVTLNKRAEQLSIFYRLLAMAMSGLEARNLMTLALGEAARVLNFPVGAVLLVDESKTRLELVARRGTLNLEPGKTISLDEGLPGQVLASGKPFLSNDFETNQQLITPILKYSKNPVRSCIYVPIKTDTEKIGLIMIGSPQTRQYGSEDLDFLTGLANLLAMTLFSYQLYREREQAASSEERNRIARDLHDGLAQSINYIGLKTQLVKELYQAQESEQVQLEIERIGWAAEQARADVREVLYGLRHTESDRSLLMSLTDLVRRTADLSGLKINMVTSPPAEWPPLSLTTQIQLLRVVQEALSNVQKHSQATQAEVEAIYRPAEQIICLSVCDNGVGFAPMEVRPNKSHGLGLNIMRERASQLGANLIINSQPGNSTKIQIEYRLATQERVKPAQKVEIR
jgi:signal transduction histidine kinase